jgi:hypothetical protein
LQCFIKVKHADSSSECLQNCSGNTCPCNSTSLHNKTPSVRLLNFIGIFWGGDKTRYHKAIQASRCKITNLLINLAEQLQRIKFVIIPKLS